MKKRNTPAKKAILDMLQSSKKAWSHDDVLQEMNGSMDKVTIYRTLNSFCEDGYIHRIVADDGKQYFAVCINCKEHAHHHDHFHFRCLSCQRVECLKEEVKVKMPKGYTVENVNCMLTGYCRECA